MVGWTPAQDERGKTREPRQRVRKRGEESGSFQRDATFRVFVRRLEELLYWYTADALKKKSALPRRELTHLARPPRYVPQFFFSRFLKGPFFYPSFFLI